ncbi:MAG TPA: hypothetical protein VF452_17870 [Candidatus Binatia bacterium]
MRTDFRIDELRAGARQSRMTNFPAKHVLSTAKERRRKEGGPAVALKAI